MDDDQVQSAKSTENTNDCRSIKCNTEFKHKEN